MADVVWIRDLDRVFYDIVLDLIKYVLDKDGIARHVDAVEDVCKTFHGNR